MKNSKNEWNQWKRLHNGIEVEFDINRKDKTMNIQTYCLQPVLNNKALAVVKWKENEYSLINASTRNRKLNNSMLNLRTTINRYFHFEIWWKEWNLTLFYPWPVKLALNLKFALERKTKLKWALPLKYNLAFSFWKMAVAWRKDSEYHTKIDTANVMHTFTT